ncbi:PLASMODESMATA CALLOSE-BINDING PROTEIN 5-like [Macadamia integrifolia]|uniref:PLASMODESMATA CALLOSE-BINDING PROTEIN 5-like n=1 Tax=Macadamia integrifolia TaxID=60698 RepID=UPI001C52B6CC|nr:PLASMODESMATA CALLOSE-BINDING PROTEIN 5-like [Macadamia integrifolia]
MAAISITDSRLQLLSLILITVLVHCTAVPDKSVEATSSHLSKNSDLESKANSGGAPLWCVAKNNAEDTALQSALDWACGLGGSDCGAIQQGGPCYDRSNLQNVASYAFNDYYLKHGMTSESCNFGNSASLTSLDPSWGKCQFPSKSSVAVNGSFGGTAQTGPMGYDFSGDKAVDRWSRTLVITPLVFTSTLLAFQL